MPVGGYDRGIALALAVLLASTVAGVGSTLGATPDGTVPQSSTAGTASLPGAHGGDTHSSNARETALRNSTTPPGADRLGRDTRSERVGSEGVRRDTTLSFESGAAGDRRPPDPWFLLSDPSAVDRNDIAEVSDEYASDGRLSMHIGSYDPDALNRIRVGVLVDLSGVDTVVYDGYVEANNPYWGDIKLNVGSTTVSNELVQDSPPEDRWYRDVTADVSAYEGTHLLSFWVRGDGNDVYLDNVRFRDGTGKRIPVSRVVLPVTEYTFDPLDSYAVTTTNLTFPEANVGLNDPYAVADATVNGTRGTGSITASAGSDGVLGVGIGAEGALGRTSLGFVCNASRDGTYIVSSAYTTTGELSYFRGGSGGVSVVRTGVTSNLTVRTNEYPPSTVGAVDAVVYDILSPASVFDPETNWNALLPVIKSFVDSYVGLPVTDAAEVAGVDLRTTASGSHTLQNDSSLAVRFDAQRGQEYVVTHRTTAASIVVMNDTPALGNPDADSTADVEQHVEIHIPGSHPCNRPAVASVEPDKNASSGSTVTVNATAKDPDNPLPYGASPRPFSWKQVRGPAVELKHPNSRRMEFTAPNVEEPTTLTFEFTVTDAAFRQHPLPDSDRINVTVVPGNGSATDGRTLSLAPDSRRAEPGRSVTYDVVVSNVSDGVGSYDLEVSVSDPSVATITDASNEIGGTKRIEIADDGSSAHLGAFAGDTVDRGTDVTIASVTVTGQARGTATLTIDLTSVGDERGGDQYAFGAVTDATVSVGEPDAPVVGDSDAPARDPDGDGRYEDVNGDGSVTPGDATVLFDSVFSGDPAVTENASLFDFNGDGSVTPGDATVLFEGIF